MHSKFYTKVLGGLTLLELMFSPWHRHIRATWLQVHFQDCCIPFPAPIIY